MFKIVNENYEQELQDYKLPESWDVSVGDETWIKIRITDIMGFSNICRLVHNPNNVDGSKYLGFEIMQVGGNLVNKEELKSKVIDYISNL